MVSKSKIDRAGQFLAKTDLELADAAQVNEMSNVFDYFRKGHLQPLSETTLELQHWLGNYGGSYYIAQRLKRKPQILRKLRRLPVRLTQLQDIGGCRIIVERDSDVDKLLVFINERVNQQKQMELTRVTDYREMGRDDSGYRALHLLLMRSGKAIELQIRSKIQHYWAESIERTSVIYGYHLKEQEGDKRIISYFKKLSDTFFEIEAGRKPSAQNEIDLEKLRIESEQIIAGSDRNKVFNSYVNEGIIKTLAEKESRGGSGINNWIIVFDWNQGEFVSWDVVGRNPDDAIESYVEYENMFPASAGYEVVMIGSSDVATVRQTHSHYFGIENFGVILENLNQSIVGLSKRMDIDVGARKILNCLYRRQYWGKKTVAVSTLKNHFCRDVMTFDVSLSSLVEKGLVLMGDGQAPVSLNLKMKQKIEGYL